MCAYIPIWDQATDYSKNVFMELIFWLNIVEIAHP